MSLSSFFFVHSEMISSISIKHEQVYSLLLICWHTVKWIYIYDFYVNSLSVIQFLNELELICLHTRITIVSK